MTNDTDEATNISSISEPSTNVIASKTKALRTVALRLSRCHFATLLGISDKSYLNFETGSSESDKAFSNMLYRLYVLTDVLSKDNDFCRNSFNYQTAIELQSLCLENLKAEGLLNGILMFTAFVRRVEESKSQRVKKNIYL